MTCARSSHLPLIPAKAGIRRKSSGRRPDLSIFPRNGWVSRPICRPSAASDRWIPACAGMSAERASRGEA